MRAEMISYYDLITLFTIMVLMAIVTTLMASPLFELIYGRRAVALAKERAA